MRGKRRLLCRGVYQATFGFATIFAVVERDDQCALRSASKAQRRRIVHSMRLIAKEELLRLAQQYWKCCCWISKPDMQPIEMQQRNIFRARLSIEHASRLHAFAQIHESSTHSRPGALVGRAGNASHQ